MLRLFKGERNESEGGDASKGSAVGSVGELLQLQCPHHLTTQHWFNAIDSFEPVFQHPTSSSRFSRRITTPGLHGLQDDWFGTR